MSQEMHQPVGQAKKALPTLAWVGIGCGVFIMISFVIVMALGFFAVKKGKEVIDEATGGASVSDLIEEFQEDPVQSAAELAIRMNPDLEIVSTDEGEGTLTFRDLSSGEESTLHFKDIAEGRFGITNEEGEFTYSVEQDSEQGGVTIAGPDGEAHFGASSDLGKVPDWVSTYPDLSDLQSTFRTASGSMESGIVTGKTTDSASQVLSHYKAFFEAQGWEVTSESSTTTGDGAFAMLTGKDPDSGRSLNLGVIEADGSTQVTLNYLDELDSRQ